MPGQENLITKERILTGKDPGTKEEKPTRPDMSMKEEKPTLLVLKMKEKSFSELKEGIKTTLSGKSTEEQKDGASVQGTG